MSEAKKVAVLGLGAMGSRMAARLVAAGHAVTVYNRSDAPAEALVVQGATRAPTPRRAAEGADAVIAMLTDDRASRAVWLHPETGALAGMAPDAVAIESSTLTPGWVRELGRAAKERGVAFLDAPVAGSRPQAEQGILMYMVGSDEAALLKARPLLDELGGAVHHMGPVGAGATQKLVVNALFATQVAVLGELLAFADRSGVPAERALEALVAMPVTSKAAAGVGGLILKNFTQPMFPIDLVEKDLRYVGAAARANGGEAPTSEAVRAVYGRAQEAGCGGMNINAVAKLFSR